MDARFNLTSVLKQENSGERVVYCVQFVGFVGHEKAYFAAAQRRSLATTKRCEGGSFISRDLTKKAKHTSKYDDSQPHVRLVIARGCPPRPPPKSRVL